jgi:hypothetical protein
VATAAVARTELPFCAGRRSARLTGNGATGIIGVRGSRRARHRGFCSRTAQGQFRGSTAAPLRFVVVRHPLEAWSPSHIPLAGRKRRSLVAGAFPLSGADAQTAAGAGLDGTAGTVRGTGAPLTPSRQFRMSATPWRLRRKHPLGRYHGSAARLRKRRDSRHGAVKRSRAAASSHSLLRRHDPRCPSAP